MKKKNIVLVLGIFAVFILGFTLMRSIDNVNPTVSFKGIEGSDTVDVEITSNKANIKCDNALPVSQLKNGSDIVITCHNTLLPFVKRSINYTVKGLYTTSMDEQKANSVFDQFSSGFATTIAHQSFDTILAGTDEKGVNIFIPIFIIDDHTFSYYFFNNIYFENEEMVQLEGSEKVELKPLAIASGATMDQFESLITTYKDRDFIVLRK